MMKSRYIKFFSYLVLFVSIFTATYGALLDSDSGLVIISPNSEEYKKECAMWNAKIKARPAAVLLCSNNEHVKEALLWAKTHGKEVRIRSNRHSYEGLSTADDAAVIDVSSIKLIELSADKKTVKVGAGNNIYSVCQELWKHKLAIPLGSCPTVGVVGLAIGGGIGLSSRLMGLSCDNVTEIEMVDCNGNLIRANRVDYPDLFWACCGAGNGNFGIITSITFKTHLVSKVIVYNIEWQWKHIYDVSEKWFVLLKSVPKELMTFLRFTKRNSQKTLRSFGQFFGTEKELRILLKPLLEISSDAIVTIEECSYMQSVNKWAGVGPEGVSVISNAKSFKATSLYLKDDLPKEAIRIIDDYYSQPAIKDNFTVLDSYGGVINEVGKDFNAFSHRDCIASMQTLAYWEDDEDAVQQLEWSRNYYKDIASYGEGAYANYSDLELEDWEHAYYGDHWEALVSIKKKYDPENFFHHPQSVFF